MTPQKIDDLIQKEIEGLLNEEEAKELESLALSDESVRKRLAEALWMHGQMMQDADTLSLENSQASSIQPKKRISSTITIISAAAAAVLFFWLGAFVKTEPEKAKPVPAVATLVKAENCFWGASELPTVPNSPLPPGILNLKQGIAVIQFTNGAELVMEAPSEVNLIDPMYIKLLGGSVVMDVPEQAIGFTVETKEGNVVDYGTKFGITVTEFSKPQVWVFDGEVEIQSDKKQQRVYGGQSIAFGEAPKDTTGEANVGDKKDLKEGWSSITPYKDNYMRKGHKAISHKSPLLMVKYSSLAHKNVRLSYISFDLSQFDMTKLVDAELSLELQPSGKGFAAHIPDCEFSIYGFNEDPNWEEKKIVDKTAPGFDLTTNKLKKEGLTQVGRLFVAKGVSTGSRSIRSKELVNYLKEHHGQKVTFVIERDNDEFNNQGLANAFASKEHPTASPPRLHFKFLE